MPTPIDKDYEYAIRAHLDCLLNTILNPHPQDFLELNLVKKFYKHLLEGKPDDYKFQTPTYGWWDLTSACNFRCVHCLYNDTEYSNKDDLTTEQVFRLCDELINDFKIFKIILTGGEIFMHPNLIDVVKQFKENNVAVQLMTNAGLMNDEHIEILSGIFNPYTDLIQISLDGATSETFKKIRRTELFDKIVSNIKKLVNNGLKVRVACTINSINYHEIEAVYELCDSIGVEAVLFGRTIYYNESHKDLMVSNRDLFILNERLIKLRNQERKTVLVNSIFSILDLVGIPEVLEILNEDKYLPILKLDNEPIRRDCHFHDRFSIRSNGKIYLCLDSNCEDCCVGDYKKNSMLEIWQNLDKNPMFQPRTLDKMVCKDCKFNRVCRGGCKAQAYEKFRDINCPSSKCILFNPEK